MNISSQVTHLLTNIIILLEYEVYCVKFEVLQAYVFAFLLLN